MTVHDDELDVGRHARAVWRARWLILGVTLLAGAAGWFVANRTAPRFRATARMMAVTPYGGPVDHRRRGNRRRDCESRRLGTHCRGRSRRAGVLVGRQRLGARRRQRFYGGRHGRRSAVGGRARQRPRRRRRRTRGRRTGALSAESCGARRGRSPDRASGVRRSRKGERALSRDGPRAARRPGAGGRRRSR